MSNKYKVPTKMWNKWSEDQRKMFNAVYASLTQEFINAHPNAPELSDDVWRTIRWNSAFIAAVNR